MKKNILSFAFALVFGLVATANPIKGEKKTIKSKESKVTWKGHKISGTHEGTINVKEGALIFDGKKLVGGEVIMDMSTINTTDLSGDGKAKLDNHLKSDDFFSTQKHKTAKLVFTNVKAESKNSYKVTGDLTIKGKTKPVTFNITISGNTATANLKVDRTKYDIKYGSGSFFDNLGDKAIYDEFDLIASLKF
jgi:polyisoprenoid-binding protein YceI